MTNIDPGPCIDLPSPADDLVERLLSSMDHGLERDRDMTFYVNGSGPGSSTWFPIEYSEVLAVSRANKSLRAQLAAAEAELETQRDSQISAVNQMLAAESQLASARKALEAVKQYTFDLRRNSSGGDDAPEWMHSVADYVDELIRRALSDTTGEK